MLRNLEIIFLIFLLVFSFFSYVCVGVCAESDLQPASLILCFFYFLFFTSKSEMILTPFLVTAFIALLLFLWGPDWGGLNSVLGYLSIFLYGTVFFNLYKKENDLFRLLLAISIFFILLIGFLQIISTKDFLSILLYYSRTSLTRGVTSLTPEPSALINILVMMVALFFLIEEKNFSKKNYQLFGFLTLLLAVFMGGSLASLATLGLCLLVLGINRPIFIPFLAIVFGALTLIAVDYLVFPGNLRAISLLKIFLDDPSSLFLRDFSANDRAAHIFGSAYSFFLEGGLPSGFNGWKNFVDLEIRDLDFFKKNTYLSDQRVMSTFGAGLFEIGAFALIPTLGVLIYLVRFSGKLAFQLGFSVLCFLWLSPISLNTPVLGMLLGVLYAKAEENRV